METKERKNLIKAWERYLNDACTGDDLTIVLDSMKDDEQMEAIQEVFKAEWDNYNLPPTPEDRKEVYRKKAAQLLAEHQDRQRIHSSRSIAGRIRKIGYAAAAVLLLGLLIPVAHLYIKSKTEQAATQSIEVVCLRGEIKTVVLPEQTEVTLNAGSRIVYPVHFTGNKRSVELQGEALFSVTPDPARPFTVHTENMHIKVVGTVFNVKSYTNDASTTVSVASGKVEVGLADERIMLERNQQLKTDKSTGLYEKTFFDADNCLSWKDGVLFFQRTPVREVVNMLNRHFQQVEIVLVEGEYASLISGKHEKGVAVEDVLKSIVYVTGLKCKKTGENKYTLYK
jgi:ferric-dicitrate binding protein FerR (iron transport regulator)